LTNEIKVIESVLKSADRTKSTKLNKQQIDKINEILFTDKVDGRTTIKTLKKQLKEKKFQSQIGEGIKKLSDAPVPVPVSDAPVPAPVPVPVPVAASKPKAKAKAKAKFVF